MECYLRTSALFPRTLKNNYCHTFPSNCCFPLTCRNPLVYASSFKVKCSGQNNGDEEGSISASYAHDVLGVSPNCSADELKSAFRNKVKKFHPDIRRNGDSTDTMIRRVIQAYQMLSNFTKSEIIERECFDPFDQPECEAFDIFVDETVCIGKGCPFSCVKRAPHAFTFSTLTGTARATSQEHGKDYQVQLAVGQCPRSCIHYVTPSQRIILEELFGRYFYCFTQLSSFYKSIMSAAYDTSAEADLLYSLIVKARFENNCYQKPKKQAKASTRHVDWF